jgi:hypothetical protein
LGRLDLISSSCRGAPDAFAGASGVGFDAFEVFTEFEFGGVFAVAFGGVGRPCEPAPKK